MLEKVVVDNEGEGYTTISVPVRIEFLSISDLCTLYLQRPISAIERDLRYPFLFDSQITALMLKDRFSILGSGADKGSSSRQDFSEATSLLCI